MELVRPECSAIWRSTPWSAWPSVEELDLAVLVMGVADRLAGVGAQRLADRGNLASARPGYHCVHRGSPPRSRSRNRQGRSEAGGRHAARERTTVDLPVHGSQGDLRPLGDLGWRQQGFGVLVCRGMGVHVSQRRRRPEGLGTGAQTPSDRAESPPIRGLRQARLERLHPACRARSRPCRSSRAVALRRQKSQVRILPGAYGSGAS